MKCTYFRLHMLDMFHVKDYYREISFSLDRENLFEFVVAKTTSTGVRAHSACGSFWTN